MRKPVAAALLALVFSGALSAGEALEQLHDRAGTGPAAQAAATIPAAPGRLGGRDTPPALPGDINQIVTAWRKACGEAAVYSNPGCRIRECDLMPSACRPGRLLLFRGETERNKYMAVSGLYRSALMGSDFLPENGGPEALAGQLKKELETIRPMKQVPRKELGPYENQIVLVRNMARHGWYWRFDKTGEEDPALRRPFAGKYARTAQEAFSFMETVFYLHKNGPFPDYKDAKLGIVSIDPFVSFSLNAEVAIGFPIYALQMESAINGSTVIAKTPYLIIASVPEPEIVTRCGEEVQEPGTVLDPARSCRGYNDYNEHELASFMFTKPEYLLGSLQMPKDFVTAWLKRGQLPDKRLSPAYQP